MFRNRLVILLWPVCSTLYLAWYLVHKTTPLWIDLLLLTGSFACAAGVIVVALIKPGRTEGRRRNRGKG